MLSALFPAVLLHAEDQKKGEPALTILYPKHNAIVGAQVNVVVDPATDWSKVPMFQIVVGKSEYPPIDPSGGKHAMQGVLLAPGINTITVRALAPAVASAQTASSAEKPVYNVLFSRTIAVYSRNGYFTAPPSPFTAQRFHSREGEAACTDCHRLQAEQQDRAHAKPEDVLCYACHRNIPTGKYIHGPAAVWNCLGCHDSSSYPVKYQFTSEDPWKVSKTTQAIEPLLVTIPSNSLFKPRSSELITVDPALPGKNVTGKQRAALLAQREQALKKMRDERAELFKPILDHLKGNPGDKVLIESHVDGPPQPAGAEKEAAWQRSMLPVTVARAGAVARLLKEMGIGGGRVAAVGMSALLPKVAPASPEAREQNDRIEVVVYPADEQVQNSQQPAMFKDRMRVTVKMEYARGATVRGVTLIERLPSGIHYLKGSSVFRGKPKEPQQKGNELIWQLGDLGNEFQETVRYTVKRDAGTTATVSPVQQISFQAGKSQETRDFDPDRPVNRSTLTIQQSCTKCHPGLMDGKIKHGPSDAGYCVLCHDPHASNNPSWVRLPSWTLCTHCHPEQREGTTHVISGFGMRVSHPTRKGPDYNQPGKTLACVSCHSPHSGDTAAILAYNVKTKMELCRTCHKQK